MSELDLEAIKAAAINNGEAEYEIGSAETAFERALAAAVDHVIGEMKHRIPVDHPYGIKAALQERPEDNEAFIYATESWPVPRLLCSKPKLSSIEAWRPVAQEIIKALAAYGMPTGTYGDGRTEKNQQGTRKKIERYSGMLDKAGIRAENKSHLGNEGMLSLPHIYWMLETLDERILNEDPVYDDGKISRWLGFCEYGLCHFGLTNVEDERNDSRPLFRK